METLEKFDELVKVALELWEEDAPGFTEAEEAVINLFTEHISSDEAQVFADNTWKCAFPEIVPDMREIISGKLGMHS